MEITFYRRGHASSEQEKNDLFHPNRLDYFKFQFQ